MWMVYVILGTSLWRNTGSNVQHCTSPCIRCRQPTTIINARCSLVSLWWRSGCFFCYCLLFILSYTGLKMRTILDTEGGLRTCRCVQEGYIVSASLPSTITFWLPINILVHNAIFSKFASISAALQFKSLVPIPSLHPPLILCISSAVCWLLHSFSSCLSAQLVLVPLSLTNIERCSLVPHAMMFHTPRVSFVVPVAHAGQSKSPNTSKVSLSCRRRPVNWMNPIRCRLRHRLLYTAS